MTRRYKRQLLPMLNTSSLPDLVFTVLFFFMIVTHMRKETVKVKFQQPEGRELTRLTKRATTMHLYIGTRQNSQESVLQLNDKLVTPNELTDYLVDERERMSPEDLQQLTVSIKADKDTRMKVITEAKQCLRRAKVYRILYDATETEK